jgi:hypothetical protein
MTRKLYGGMEAKVGAFDLSIADQETKHNKLWEAWEPTDDSVKIECGAAYETIQSINKQLVELFPKDKGNLQDLYRVALSAIIKTYEIPGVSGENKDKAIQTAYQTQVEFMMEYQIQMSGMSGMAEPAGGAAGPAVGAEPEPEGFVDVERPDAGDPNQICKFFYVLPATDNTKGDINKSLFDVEITDETCELIYETIIAAAEANKPADAGNTEGMKKWAALGCDPRASLKAVTLIEGDAGLPADATGKFGDDLGPIFMGPVRQPGYMDPKEEWPCIGRLYGGGFKPSWGYGEKKPHWAGYPHLLEIDKDLTRSQGVINTSLSAKCKKQKPTAKIAWPARIVKLERQSLNFYNDETEMVPRGSSVKDLTGCFLEPIQNEQFALGDWAGTRWKIVLWPIAVLNRSMSKKKNRRWRCDLDWQGEKEGLGKVEFAFYDEETALKFHTAIAKVTADYLNPPQPAARAQSPHELGEELFKLIEELADFQGGWNSQEKQAAGVKVTDLLTRGADVNYNDGMKTTLMIAVSYAPTEIIKMLIDGGANVNADTRDIGSTPTVTGVTALMIAARWGNVLWPMHSTHFPAVCEMLLEAGADVTVNDSQLRSAADHAEEMEHKSEAKLLNDRAASSAAAAAVTESAAAAAAVTESAAAAEPEVDQTDLPPNWTKVPSVSRSGEFSYEHVTGFKREHLPKNQPPPHIDEKLLAIKSFRSETKKTDYHWGAKSYMEDWYALSKMLRQMEGEQDPSADMLAAIARQKGEIKTLEDEIESIEI